MLPESWVDALFSRFEGLYGTQFAAKWNGLDVANVKNVWAETLSGISGEQIKAALIECGKTCKFPPSAPEFYQLCIAFKPEPSHTLNLPKLHVKDTEVGLQRINEIKKMLADKMRVVYD
jgi:hypothetical protein